MAETIEICRSCEKEDLHPVTVHKLVDNGRNSLFMVQCNNAKCMDFVPVKIASDDIRNMYGALALDVWNKVQLDRDEQKKKNQEKNDG